MAAFSAIRLQQCSNLQHTEVIPEKIEIDAIFVEIVQRLKRNSKKMLKCLILQLFCNTSIERCNLLSRFVDHTKEERENIRKETFSNFFPGFSFLFFLRNVILAFMIEKRGGGEEKGDFAPFNSCFCTTCIARKIHCQANLNRLEREGIKGGICHDECPGEKSFTQKAFASLSDQRRNVLEISIIPTPLPVHRRQN